MFYDMMRVAFTLFVCLFICLFVCLFVSGFHDMFVH